MTKFLEHALRASRLFILGVLYLLAACGPGGGGTGSGPDGLAASPPPPPVVFVFTSAASGPPACGSLNLRIEEGRVALATACGNFVFVGAWTADANHEVVLTGVLENPVTGAAVPAKLRLQFSGTPETSQSVTVTVTDETGHNLVGPEVLGR